MLKQTEGDDITGVDSTSTAAGLKTSFEVLSRPFNFREWTHTDARHDMMINVLNIKLAKKL